MKKNIFVFLMIMGLVMTVPLHGAQPGPMEQVKVPIEKGIALLKDPQYTAPDKKEPQREKIWEIVREAFDFKLISMRALARSWRDFNAKQQEEFIAEFTELLRNTYIDKIQGEFHDEEIVFLGEDMISKDKAVVKSKILRGKVEIPMDYSMHFHGDKWWIYDINIEGVSLVSNYRSQFKNILEKEKPDQLIQRLKEKNEKHERGRGMDLESADEKKP
ncbi:MAG: ABC transporter substrate-binding protein [Desulfobacterales bacterium]